MTDGTSQIAFDLSGKTTIITGATGGIGQGIAKVLARGGSNLVLHTHSGADDATRLREEVMELGGNAVVVEGDTASLDDGERFVRQALDSFGRIDHLVNNAGIIELFPLEDLTETSWDRTLSVNLRGPVFLTNAVLSHLREQRSGCVINISSSISANEGAGPEGIRTTCPRQV